MIYERVINAAKRNFPYDPENPHLLKIIELISPIISCIGSNRSRWDSLSFWNRESVQGSFAGIKFNDIAPYINGIFEDFTAKLQYFFQSVESLGPRESQALIEYVQDELNAITGRFTALQNATSFLHAIAQEVNYLEQTNSKIPEALEIQITDSVNSIIRNCSHKIHNLHFAILSTYCVVEATIADIHASCACGNPTDTAVHFRANLEDCFEKSFGTKLLAPCHLKNGRFLGPDELDSYPRILDISRLPYFMSAHSYTVRELENDNLSTDQAFNHLRKFLTKDSVYNLFQSEFEHFKEAILYSYTTARRVLFSTVNEIIVKSGKYADQYHLEYLKNLLPSFLRQKSKLFNAFFNYLATRKIAKLEAEKQSFLDDYGIKIVGDRRIEANIRRFTDLRLFFKRANKLSRALHNKSEVVDIKEILYDSPLPIILIFGTTLTPFKASYRVDSTDKHSDNTYFNGLKSAIAHAAYLVATGEVLFESHDIGSWERGSICINYSFGKLSIDSKTDRHGTPANSYF